MKERIDSMDWSGNEYANLQPNIITILHDNTKNGTSCVMNVEELVHSAVNLVVIVPFIVFVVGRRNLRKKKSHQLFLNLLFVHMCFNISVFVSNFLNCSNNEVIVNCSFLVSIFFALMLLSLERMVSIKLPFLYRDVEVLHVLITIVVSWLPGVLFLCVLLVRGTNEETLDIMTTSFIGTASLVLIVSNVVVYRAAKHHDTFVKNNTVKQKMLNGQPPGKGKFLKASYICFALVATFVVLWLPYLVHNILAFVGLYKPDSVNLFSKVVEHVAQLNTIVDVVLFVWLSRDLKNEVKTFLNKIRRNEKRNNHDIHYNMKQTLVSKTSTFSNQRTEITAV